MRKGRLGGQAFGVQRAHRQARMFCNEKGGEEGERNLVRKRGANNKENVHVNMQKYEEYEMGKGMRNTWGSRLHKSDVVRVAHNNSSEYRFCITQYFLILL